ncbi:MAG: 50S ribosomal protein L19, partial [Eubacteriales bacterium]
MDKIEAFVSEQLKTEVPQFAVGDTVKVHNLIKEGTRERIQIFEGTVIAKHGGGNISSKSMMNGYLNGEADF